MSNKCTMNCHGAHWVANEKYSFPHADHCKLLDHDQKERMNASDLSLQDKVRADKTSCDHIGFYTPLGHDAFPVATGGFVIQSSVLCMMCGQQWHGITEILNKPADIKPNNHKIHLPS